MKALKTVFLVFAVMLFMSTAVYAEMDIEEFPTGFFTPTSSTSAPYYRWWDEDWGWQHDGINVVGSAELSISAWDVDWQSGEVDIIYAKDEGNWVQIGTLGGLNNDWSYTTFTLGSNFFDEIETGLEVWIDIDTTHNYDNWAVLLAKSVLITDGEGTLPDPEPNPQVPEPATLLLLGLGLVGVAGVKKALKK